jgi:hypothetical protein
MCDVLTHANVIEGAVHVPHAACLLSVNQQCVAHGISVWHNLRNCSVSRLVGGSCHSCSWAFLVAQPVQCTGPHSSRDASAGTLLQRCKRELHSTDFCSEPQELSGLFLHPKPSHQHNKQHEAGEIN